MKSKAQYHIRELSKCLAHAGGRSFTECVDDGVESESDSDETEVDDQEEEQSGREALNCPLGSCDLKVFDTAKELQRHFAIRTSQLSPSCYILLMPV